MLIGSHSLERVFEVLLVLGVPIAFFASIVMVGRRILGPIDRASKARRYPIRFHIIDFFCLIVELQIVMVVATSIYSDRSVQLVLGVVLVGTTLVVWFKGVAVLSSAGIDDPGRRAAFNWFVLPFTCVSAPASFPLIVIVIMRTTERGFDSVSGWLWLVVIALLLVLGLAYVASRWIVESAKDPVNGLASNTLDGAGDGPTDNESQVVEVGDEPG